MIRHAAAAGLAWALAGCASAPLDAASQARPVEQACPAALGFGTRCLSGRDSAGAYYWIALPQAWNGVLVLHAHGGPEFGPPALERATSDLKRWSVWPRAGYAYAGSSFRQGGVAVRAAAEDTERLRTIFTEAVGRPKRTVLHGQSWGGNVAAVGAEMYGPGSYDAVLLTSGVLAGGSKAYEFRLDLRVVYQALCGNLPRPGEPQYPLWQGLPAGATLSRREIHARIDECTGLDHPAVQRTAVQQTNLKTLLAVIHVPERSLRSHLEWSLFGFQDIVFKRLDGRNPFGNTGARYVGSADDAALNAQVARYRADPAALAAFAADADPTGRIALPVLTVHAVDDPTAFVELESAYRDTVERAGAGDHLVQVFTQDHDHSYLSDAQYLAAMQSLLGWVERGVKPTPASVAAACRTVDAAFDPATGCRFLPDYRPQPLATRVAPRTP